MTMTSGEIAVPTLPADLVSAVGVGAWAVDDLVAEVQERAHDSRPFADDSLELCEALSKDLLLERAHPEIVSLGYWLRPASLARAREALERAASRKLVIVPRGLAVHVTPANVDTMFAYSWLVSLLAGNANIVRLSSRSTGTRARILEGVGRLFAEPRFAALAARNRLVLGSHDERVGSALSAAADVRIVWGGDGTVERFRRYPMPVRGKEIVFPDRHSLAILDAAAVLDLDDAGLARFGDAFFNDAFWFDQAACSSPRLIVWRSAADEEATVQAQQRFHDAALAAVRRRGYLGETGNAINKMVFALEVAAQEDDIVIDTPSNEITWVGIRGLERYDRRNCGGGLFFEYVSHDLVGDLSRLARPADQTAACFGLAQEDVMGLALALNGRGIDRFVRMGRALEFGTEWDGLDLFAELSRRVVVDVD